MKKLYKEIIVSFGIVITVLILSKILLSCNFIYFFKAWSMLLIIGIIFYPLSMIIFKPFNDRGWIFSKVLGIAISAVVVWLLSYIKIVKFSVFSIYFVLAMALVITVVIFSVKKVNLDDYVKKIPWKHILVTEVVFMIAFVCWIYIRSFKVPIDASTEQFMNYGFMNKIMNSSYFPVEDIWFSGEHINYYYFGQYIAAFVNLASCIDAKAGYGLMLALVSAITVVLPFSIALNLGMYMFKKHGEDLEINLKFSWSRKLNDFYNRVIKLVLPYIIAIIAGLSVSIGGTLYYPIYNWIVPRPEGSEYSYWEAVRYIGYRPETNDKTITDIPAYSNVAQDLHAHYTDLIFVFTTIALLLALMLKEVNDEKQKCVKSRFVPLFSPIIILLGVILGLQKMTNYWDFPIYGVVISIIIIANNLLKYKLVSKNIVNTILQIAQVFIIEEIVTLPFSFDLYMSSTQVLFTNVMSPIHKLAVLWGLPTICVFFNLVVLIIKLLKQKRLKFMDRLKNLSKSDIFVLLIGLCAVGLVIMPEIIYLKDIYGDEYKRANTMFKLTYQAYVLFSISSSYILVRYLFSKGNKIKNVFAGLLLLVHLTTFSYGITAIMQQRQYNDNTISDLSNVEGYIEKYYKSDYDAIQWIKENISKDEVILEKVTGSYEISGRISVFTGNPTVLAWYGHEWIWRSDENYQAPEEQRKRWGKIYELYTCGNSERIKEIANEFNISYVYVGELENMESSYKIDAIIDAGEVVYKEYDVLSQKNIYLIKIH